MDNLERDLIDLMLEKVEKLPWAAWCRFDKKCISRKYFAEEFCHTVYLSAFIIRNGLLDRSEKFDNPDRLMIAKIFMVLHYHANTPKAKIDSANQSWEIEFKIIDDVNTIGHRNIGNFTVLSGEEYCEKAMQLFRTAKKYANFASKSKKAGVTKPEAFIQVLSILKQI